MSIDFDGTTSKLENTTADIGQSGKVLTICALVYADGQGEGSLGVIAATPENAGAGGGSGGGLRHHNVANTLGFTYDFTGGGSADGVWSFPATDSQWNRVALSYDGGATTNVPVARVNFASQTVTTVTTPVGTGAPMGTGAIAGNVTGQTRTWDGALQHVQFFSVILSAQEMDMACRRPGSVRRGLRLWWDMGDAARVQDLSGNGFTGTATGLTTRDGAPYTPLWAGDYFGWRGAFTAAAVAAAATTGFPWLYYARHRGA